MNQPTEVFGLLGPEQLPSTRRLRTLGLGATVRYFNDRAVPGMGGVWFAKQLVLALFGVQLAERTRRSKVEVANAIEALGCWLAIRRRQVVRDPRIRGVRKLAHVAEDELSFERLRKRGFYVSQPMRMATVQPLAALGLVAAASSRFNAFECTEAGSSLLEDYTAGYRPSNQDLDIAIERWIRGKEIKSNSPLLRQALDPGAPLPKSVQDQILERLKQGRPGEPDEDRRRRRGALALVEWLRLHRKDAIDWALQPTQIESDAHWHDLEAGRRFLIARDAALVLLVAIERHMRSERSVPVDRALLDSVATEIEQLRLDAQAFLDSGHGNLEAKRFCAECVAHDQTRVIRSLVDRDGVVLIRIDNRIAPGPLFLSTPADDPASTVAHLSSEAAAAAEDDDGPQAGIQWPPGMSFRMNNLFLLNLDLHGELGKELKLDDLSQGAAK